MSRKVMQMALEFIEFVWRECSINKYTEEKRSALEDVLRAELANPSSDLLGRVMEWVPVNNPPDMVLGDYGWLTSEPLLGFTRHGQMQVVTYEQIDEDCVPCWKTNCSERWDATDSLTHWSNLPQPPTR